MKPIGEDAQLLLGVDGGGTKTVACLARRSNDGQIVVLGKGRSGPGNPRGPNAELAYRNIAEAKSRRLVLGKRLQQTSHP